MRSALAAAAQRRVGRSRSSSLSAVPPAESSNAYLPELAAVAASILYRSPLPSQEGRPIYILNAAAFPDAFEVDYDSLLSYVLARLPGEDELLSGTEYEIIFFAGGQPDNATVEKKTGPGMGWYLQAYHVLSRATRKKLQKLYIVHPRTWVRVLIGVFGTIVSPKSRRKIVHVNTLSQLALQIPVEKLLIPPTVYLHDRKLSPDIDVPYASGRRAFGARHPLPKNINTGKTRLPRVLRETSSFILLPANVGTEGIFRIPPHSVQAGVLKEAYDRGQRYIVWKEKSATLEVPGMDQHLMDEVRLEDSYGVHLAAALIKLWYRELRDPIFPESSYEPLRQQYSNPDTEVTVEDLVDLILPLSPTSPLSTTAREILTRHLLPFLSAVAVHEPRNKMSAENLAICFGMCLVCGSNQLEDAKMSSILRRILQAAIEVWPQLRDGMGIDVRALETDLRAPADSRDYEDPLEEVSFPKRSSEDDAIEIHRIVLDDLEEKSKSEVRTAPSLPPRPRARASSAAKKLLTLDVTSPLKRKPTPANAASASTTPVGGTPTSATDPVPPSILTSEPSTTDSTPGGPLLGPETLDPPRYSTVFDADGHSILVADSPASYIGPVANGFNSPSTTAAATRRNETYPTESEKKAFPVLVVPPPTDPHPALNIPKRKALSTANDTTPTGSTARSISEGTTTLARLAAQKAAAGLAQRLAAPASGSTTPNEEVEVTVQSPQERAILSEGDGLFRKPSLAASATRRQQPPIRNLALPPPPVKGGYTVPLPNSVSGSMGGLTAPSMPKPRAPSPGLLKRMSEMEGAKSTGGGGVGTGVGGRSELVPRKMNVKKASVDDLRRLYEERVSTAQGLKLAEGVRRGSGQS